VEAEYIIIGTAGHVDHGKTVLIKALTGVDTDRLEEEKERGISIDLGFAPFVLPGGRLAGVVDVPGHERFIHNMLAGAAGMDLVLLVVDASEGVMPQTREHLDILELLQVQKGIVVITKVDLVEEDWRELVQEEIREELKGTFLEKAPLCAVSAVTGEGLEELKELIDAVTRDVVPRDPRGPLRLPVDRSFTISGFGTVVTGTLFQGTVRQGDTVEIVPPGLQARVRNIQVHGRDLREARAGQRVALNLSGVDKEEIQRGCVVGAPGYYRVTGLVDATLKLLPRASRPLKNLDPVHFYLGTARAVARLVLLDREELLPGEAAPVQCRLDRPLVAERRDPFIIRSYSPTTTIGGGVILDPFPSRHRRFREEVVRHLKALEQELASGEGEAFVRQKLEALPGAGLAQLSKATRLSEAQLEEILTKLVRQGAACRLGGGYVAAAQLEEWREKILARLRRFHSRYPLMFGLSRAELRGELPESLSLRQYDALLEIMEQEKQIAVRGELISLHGYQPQPGAGDREKLDRLLGLYRSGGFQPPSLREAMARSGVESGRQEEYLSYLTGQGLLQKINEELYFHRDTYREAVELLRRHFEKAETLTLAQFRDLTRSSRKFIQPLLEHFDQRGLTRRVGDQRVARKIAGLGKGGEE
jgi:selenocysteine-specific elongation factor